MMKRPQQKRIPAVPGATVPVLRTATAAGPHPAAPCSPAHVPVVLPRPARTLTLALAALAAAAGAHAGPGLTVERSAGAPGGVRLRVEGDAGRVQTVEASGELGARADWTPVGAAEGGGWTLEDDRAPEVGRRFYRARASDPPAIEGHPTWKGRVRFPDDPFRSRVLLGGDEFSVIAEELRFIKFTIFLDDLTRVYFQDSSTYEFHYDFARERLGPFAGFDRAAFEAATLGRAGQRAVLGALIMAEGAGEYAVQFAGNDPYPPEMVRLLIETVEAAVDGREGAAGFYIPTFEQAAAAEAASDYFARRGITVSSAQRWVHGDECYAPGWTIGRLVALPAAEIGAAFREGRLRAADVLITDTVPAEIPPVAGVLTRSPATPNSHVAILARSYGVPFAHLADEAEAEAVWGWDGATVALRVQPQFCRVTVFPLDPATDPEYVAEVLAYREPPELELSPVRELGRFSASPAELDALTPDDVAFFGGKAAHFGFLRRVVPENAPPAVAFSFDLWQAYLDQALPGGGGATLREAIAARLGSYTWPVEDPVALLDDLRAVRELVREEADFDPGLRAEVIDALAPFDSGRRIRFRSSTNVEDSATFVGAGLYDSFSGCLMDDLDGDDEGPSHCDPSRERERGVFRALRKVYASFYNDNAFIERLRRGVDESEVGMAVLVHHSFPDETELANGVATASYSETRFRRSLETEMVSQLGASPVTNPSGDALPEVLTASSSISSSGPRTFLALRQRSNLLRLGEDTVMDYEADYRALDGMFFALADSYRAFFPEKAAFTLDFEYKKVAAVLGPGQLVIKQLRELPAPGGEAAPAHALFHRPARLRVFQGEFGTVTANHRLKSFWQLRADERWLDEAGRSTAFFTDAEWEHILPGEPTVESGDPRTWAGAVHRVEEITPTFVVAVDSWSGESAAGGATRFSLRTNLPTPPSAITGPVLTVADIPPNLEAVYSRPLLTIDQRMIGSSDTDVVRLEVAPAGPPPPGSLPQVRHASARRGAVEIEVRFVWPPPPRGIVAGYTAPLVAWEGTTVTGLTPEPFTLTGEYAQTYRPGHHNFTEDFLFEPALDPGLPAAAHAALEAADIRLLYLHLNFDQVAFQAIGADGRLRDL